MEFDKDSLLKLYPGYDKVFGPYDRYDGRKHIVLFKTKVPNQTPDKRRTMSYSKAYYESVTGERLIGDQTIDHIDNDKTNDDFNNLQILTLAENARKGSIGNTYCLGHKHSQEYKEKKSGENNGMSKLEDNEVLELRRQFSSKKITKKEIMEKTGMSDKGVRNFLTGVSYSYVGEECPPGKSGRPKKN